MRAQIIPPEIIRAYFGYIAETGDIFWIGPKIGRKRLWQRCTYRTSCGYLNVCLEDKRFQASRIAWVVMTGKWPKHEIDHINGVRTDNRWSNLRDITHAENMRNQARHREANIG